MTTTTKPETKDKMRVQESEFFPADEPLPETAVSPPPSFKPKPLLKWSTIFALTLIVTFLLWQVRVEVWTLLSLVGDQDAVSAYLQSYGAWGPVALAVAQLLQVLIAVIPGHVFLIAAGYVYGFWPGLLLNMVCIVAASQLAFALARWAGRPVVDRLADQETLDKWYAIGEKQGFTFFTIAFVLPVFPTDMMNFVAGLTGITGLKFLAANILGRFPSAVILTMIGAYGIQFTTWHWAAIGLFAASVFIAGRIVVGRIERRHALATKRKTEEEIGG